MPLSRGIVEYFGCSRDEHPCGYCKGTKPAQSDYGMWAHQLVPSEYLNLMERGWRRSGKYCYKPILEKTCCPTYTIRCDASQFKLNKSKRKIIKRVNKFLMDGVIDRKGQKGISTSDNNPDVTRVPDSVLVKMSLENIPKTVDQNDQETRSDGTHVNISTSSNTRQHQPVPSTPVMTTKKCNENKSKFKRIQRRIQKVMTKRGMNESDARQLVSKEFEEKKLRYINTHHKTLEELLKVPHDSKHKITLKFVRTSFVNQKDLESEYKSTILPMEHEVYKKYQNTIHKDEDCDVNQFKRFLVDSPILFKSFPNQTNIHGVTGFGSYHMQYWLDGEKIIAVGVIDILPTGVSSVYLFYDPRYGFLGLGTYSALREIELVREIEKCIRSFNWYYMGFYIHSCPKMRYKGRYSPTFVLCPEAKTWHLMTSDVLEKFDENGYSRLNPDVNHPDEDSLDILNSEIEVFWAGRGRTTFDCFLRLNSSGDTTSVESTVREYVKLVGRKCSTSIFIYLESVAVDRDHDEDSDDDV